MNYRLMNMSPVKIATSLFLVLVLSHCSSVPKPPHCKDNGKGLQPVNHSTILNENKGGK
ncbi:MAG: hypothetical protein HAW66_07325 [Shewanella sp.]|nr:hypothetical protein [Shewanella sp.]